MQANWRNDGVSSTKRRVVSLKSGGTRRFRSKEERRQIVEETLKPGASVSVVARARDVNANQVFSWRKLYREAGLDVEPGSSRLHPVRICNTVSTAHPAPERRSKNEATGNH